VREKVSLFGPEGALLGIVTPPAPGANGHDGRTGVVILNSGVLHRIGPHRLTVKLARRLARAAFPVLRFDQSGVGDSRFQAATDSYDALAIRETRAAMDHLAAAAGVQRFVLAGLCSGADTSFATALEDERVVGVLLLDPYAYRTAGYFVRHIVERARHLDAWIGFARRGAIKARDLALSRLRRGGAGAGLDDQQTKEEVPDYVREFPPREVFAKGLRALVDRNVSVYIVYSGMLRTLHYNHHGQFESAFARYGLAGKVRCEWWPGVDHTFTALSWQQMLIDATARWASQLRGAGQQPAG
jgi:pimeloyl-ACP methyl ester carboxylesterase